jgi:enoyl-CoA hydratase/carnithine racemase
VTDWQYVRSELEDRVAVLTIDHPPINSINARVLRELRECVDQLIANDRVKVVVVTGGGTNAFVAGADIPEIRGLFDKPEDGYAAARQFIQAGQSLYMTIDRAPKPFIAAINGFCLGGGLELAMACHIRICSDRARLGNTEIRLGMIPGWGGTQRLSRTVGKGKALELILTGDMIRAQEAYRIGLVNKLVPAGAVMKEAGGLARSIAAKSRFAIAAALDAVGQGAERPLDEGMVVEAEQFVVLADKEDPREGLDAFMQKRQPEFSDR